MCGISGLISPTRVDLAALNRMTNLIRHRGPDDEGYVIFNNDKAVCLSGKDTHPDITKASIPHGPIRTLEAWNDWKPSIGFGHRRLSIVDLSPVGHQPMSYQNGRYWIIYNGEIYNYLELREELKKFGYSFISDSDTEVILAAYAQWGSKCLERFNGMWSFALYDMQKRTLMLARDRFGIKPLYYWVSPKGVLAFGSEIKQFTVLDGWQSILNPQTAYDFLVHGLTDHSEQTMFSGVYQIGPGFCAEINLDKCQSWSSGGRIETKRWYRLPINDFKGSFEDAVRVFHDYFNDAIKLHLRSDVPVGSCLSGGLDSSSIVCSVSQQIRKNKADQNYLQRTYSACSQIEDFNEYKWITAVVRQTGVSNRIVYPTIEDLIANESEITWHQDEPFGSTSIYAQWEVFKLAAKDGTKVMLDGQGADEQLAGYHGFFGARLGTLIRRYQWIEFVREVRAVNRLHGYGANELVRYIAPHVLPSSLFDLGKKFLGYAHQRPNWLRYEALGANPVNPLHESGVVDSTVQSMCISQLTRSNLQMLLHWEDRNSMANSIESRVPFLDHRLVEFAVSLPDEFKISRGITKRVLRESMRAVLPKSIYERNDKLGFATPEKIWMSNSNLEYFKKRVGCTIESMPEIFDADILQEEVGAILDGRKPFSFLPWRIVNFGQWIHRFSVNP